MQLENLTKEQFIRDFKDTLHQEQLIKAAGHTNRNFHSFGWFGP